MKYIIATTDAGSAKCTHPNRHGHVSRHNKHHTDDENTADILMAHAAEIAALADAKPRSAWEEDEDSWSLDLGDLPLSAAERELVGDWLSVTVVAESERDI